MPNENTQGILTKRKPGGSKTKSSDVNPKCTQLTLFSKQRLTIESYFERQLALNLFKAGIAKVDARKTHSNMFTAERKTSKNKMRDLGLPKWALNTHKK